MTDLILCLLIRIVQEPLKRNVFRDWRAWLVPEISPHSVTCLLALLSPRWVIQEALSINKLHGFMQKNKCACGLNFSNLPVLFFLVGLNYLSNVLPNYFIVLVVFNS
jgi:hypothetical protein